ncbi:hypothetical protein BDP67DRAFT_509162 [Colletotrichum lupini]|nr:hypothetical protein BDP67DRAFT_509162 [Colletotrichum lupini]
MDRYTSVESIASTSEPGSTSRPQWKGPSLPSEPGIPHDAESNLYEASLLPFELPLVKT